MFKDTYTKHLTELSLKHIYKQCSKKKVKNINYNSKLIVQELSINDRVKKILETEAYITIKNHKEGFPHKLSFRLLNPSKSDIHKISKNILNRINKSLIAFTYSLQTSGKIFHLSLTGLKIFQVKDSRALFNLMQRIFTLRFPLLLLPLFLSFDFPSSMLVKLQK